MNNLQFVFAIISAVAFLVPFFVWGILRFLDKRSRRVVPWHKITILITFAICSVLFITFLLLAFFLK